MGQQLFSINVETADGGLKQLHQGIDDLQALRATCDQAIEGAKSLEKTMGLNDVAVKLFEDIKSVIVQVLPKLEDCVHPLDAAVPSMIALQGEVGSMTAKNMGM